MSTDELLLSFLQGNPRIEIGHCPVVFYRRLGAVRLILVNCRHALGHEMVHFELDCNGELGHGRQLDPAKCEFEVISIDVKEAQHAEERNHIPIVMRQNLLVGPLISDFIEVRVKVSGDIVLAAPREKHNDGEYVECQDKPTLVSLLLDHVPHDVVEHEGQDYEVEKNETEHSPSQCPVLLRREFILFDVRK